MDTDVMSTKIIGALMGLGFVAIALGFALLLTSTALIMALIAWFLCGLGGLFAGFFGAALLDRLTNERD